MAHHALLVQITLFVLLLFSDLSLGSSLQNGDRFIEAVYSFGDSIADTGNLLVEGVSGGPLAAISSLPYGMTFPGKSTGRCSDGLLMIDFIAKRLRLPSPSPYLKNGSDFTHGVNFAVAGATALEKSLLVENGIIAALPATSSSLDIQLDWFKHHIRSICSNDRKACLKKRLGKSLFLVGEIGGNDYNYVFLTGKSIKEVETYIPSVVDKIINVAKELINAGALYMIVPGNFPVGCAPSYLTAFQTSNVSDYDNQHCIKDLNMFAIHHNKYLQQQLHKLRKKHPMVTIMYADYYNVITYLLNRPHYYGLDEQTLLKTCCGGGGKYNFDIIGFCGSPEATVCANPDRYLNWDGVHLTQKGYQLMTNLLTTGGFTYPNNELWKKWIS
ncbi:GDSL esterase/lipase [Zostera marina]|uniref:GDSL esterase/lipase n=1 Tax=Zostera marina TaxID=29655 RepID=A0A0K9Q128_ZOSMR|nr:GDSL esterase/lipase [Zostera marina]